MKIYGQYKMDKNVWLMNLNNSNNIFKDEKDLLRFIYYKFPLSNKKSFLNYTIILYDIYNILFKFSKIWIEFKETFIHLD